MKIIEQKDKRIIHIEFDTQYELCSSMLRMEEFYESPYDSVRGQYFTLEEYMDIYAKNTGNFTYFSDWSGFNVPGNSIANFVEIYRNRFREKEIPLVKAVHPYITKYGTEFYLIATYSDTNQQGVINHELAHAMYYLDSAYKEECSKIYLRLTDKVRTRMKEKLLQMGYTESVVPDETQAYLSTATDEEIRKHFSLPRTMFKGRKEYIENFHKWFGVE